MRIVLWLRLQLSTTNRPVCVGITDGLLVMTGMFVGMVIVTLIGRATMSAEPTYTMLNPFMIGITVMMGLVMGHVGYMASVNARSQILTRDWVRTIWGSIGYGLALPCGVWAFACALVGTVRMVTLLEAFALCSPMAILVICRSFGLRHSSDRSRPTTRTSAQL